MFRRTKRKRVIAAITVVILALAVGALAYWSATGSGEGEYAKTKASVANFEVTNTEGVELYPGGTAEAKAKVKDTEAAGSEHIKKLTAEVKSVTNSGTLVEAETGSKCYVGWFKIEKVNGTAGTFGEPNENIEHGASKEYPVEVKMLEEATKNQNGCKNVHLTLKYTVE
jgi:hypothetical protein